jgi:hypothetical protein
VFHRQCSEVSVGDEVMNARQWKKFAQQISVPLGRLRYPGRLRFKPGAHLLPSVVDQFRMFEHAWVRDQTREREHAGPWRTDGGWKRSIVDRASRARDCAERTNSHALGQGYWHRSVSVEAFAFSKGERFANIVDAGDPHATKRDRPRTYSLSRSMPPGHVVQATTQRFIDRALQAYTQATAQSFERRRDIVIKS